MKVFNVPSVVGNGILVALFLGALFGCAKNGTTTGVSLSFQGTRPASLTAAAIVRAAVQAAATVNLPVADKNGVALGTLTLTDARVAIKEIKIQLAAEEVTTTEDEADNAAIKFRGPYIVNLLTNEVTPALPTIDLKAGTYKQIEMKLAKIDGTEKDAAGAQLVPSSDPLFGNSVYLAGTYTGATASGSVSAMPFVLSYDIDETFKLTPASGTSQGFTVAANAATPVIVAFHLKQWLTFTQVQTNPDGLDFTLLSPVVSGGVSVLVLDKDAQGNNHKLRDVIKNNLEGSADYGKDDNGDGKLEASEADDAATAAKRDN